MFKKIIKIFKFGTYKVTLSTGEIAKQTLGSVIINVNDTIILSTIVNNHEIRLNNFFFPLTINYIEKSYSTGKIPRGFLKREGKPSDKEIITSRLIDRMIRPLFPKKFYNEIQIILQVLSLDPEIDPNISAAIGALTVLAVSKIPLKKSIGILKVGYIKNNFILNPSITDLKSSKLNLTISGTNKNISMIELISKELSEKNILNAIKFACNKMKIIINAINEFKKLINKNKLYWFPKNKNKYLINKIKKISKIDLEKVFNIKNSFIRNNKIKQIKKNIILNFKFKERKKYLLEIENIFLNIIYKIIRYRILNKNLRIDNRNFKTVRSINIKINILPNAHGSILFSRGNTQALVITTLGTSKDEQKIETLLGEYSDKFILHYNMLPFATKEIKKVNFPQRREIGHGNLVKKALLNILPNFKKIDYSIRIVTEITESNGSSSMASICGASLSLINAGVPIKNYVAGIAMGVIKQKNKVIILSDISSYEDYFGDMDLKIAGTINGITILQMDTKIPNIKKEIIYITLMQAKKNRMKILEKMQNKLSITTKKKISKNKLYSITIKIPVNKIKTIIGKNGAIIKKITDKTHSNIEISKKGIIYITTINKKKLKETKKIIKNFLKPLEKNKFYIGTILKILEFGILIQVKFGKNGLLHINQIKNKLIIKNFKEGQKIKIKIIEIDNKGRFKLTL